MMGRIEQAIFTSAQTDRGVGYQLVAISPGVGEADRRELAIWGPSHDSLLDLTPEAVSINFFPLPSGRFCVSRTTPAGWEYSGRGGRRVYTRFLIVPPEVLAQFANHPLALARAAAAAGLLDVLDDIPPQLSPVNLPGGAPLVDEPALATLARQIGAAHVAMLVQSVLQSGCLAVSGGAAMEDLVYGLLDCLPPECRTAISFTTGLKHSSRRPFRLVPLPADPAVRRWLAHQPGVTMLDLAAQPSGESMLVDDWARLIERTLASGRVARLTHEFSTARPDCTLGDLSALGMQLIESFEAAVLDQSEGTQRRGHAAHQRFEKSKAAATSTLPAPSQALDVDSPEVVERLESLDDAVFDAVTGDAKALDTLRTLWPAVRGELGDALVAESREQYLRYALSIWDECLGGGSLRDPNRAVTALEVLCVLFDEV